MKKLAAVVVALVLAGALYAEDGSAFKVSQLIEAGLMENLPAIKNASASLSDVDRAIIYSQNKKDSTLPLVGNLVLGFGIGSFIQGDTKGGLDLLLNSVGAWGIYGIGYGLEYAAIYSGSTSIAGSVMIIGGAAYLVVNLVRGITVPVNYAKKYNSALQSALSPGLSISPLIDADHKQLALGMAITVPLE